MYVQKIVSETAKVVPKKNILRPSILDLGTRFAAAKGWASERVFNKWVESQEWRQCLPPIFEFEVERVASPNFIIGTLFVGH